MASVRELAHSESWILLTLAVSATDAEMREKKQDWKGFQYSRLRRSYFQITTEKVIVSYLNHLLDMT